MLGCALLWLDSLDQTTGDLLAAGHPHRPWQKQVRADRGKRSLTTPTHRSQAASETASMHENRSPPSHPTDQAGSDLETSALHRSARYPTALASGALSLVLEAQVHGFYSQAPGRRRNDRLDQRDGQEESTLGC